MSLSSASGSTPSPSSSDERRDQQLQQNLATLDGSLFIASDDASPSNTRPQPSPSLASSNAQNDINESGLPQSQTIDYAALISNNNEHHANRTRGEYGRIRSQETQQTTPLPLSYADDDDSVTSGNSDRQSLIQLAQALAYDRLQQQHTQRQLRVEDVPSAARSDTANDRIAQQPEPTTLNKDDDDDNDINDLRARFLSSKDSLASGYDRQIREYNRLQQSHMQKKQQTAQTIESRPNETHGVKGEGSPFVDLDVLEAQLRERVHVSSHLSGDSMSSTQLGMGSASCPTSNHEDVGIPIHVLKAQLREYERLNRAHIQQKQPSQPSREIESIEGEQKAACKNDTAVGAGGTTDLRNSSGVGDRCIFNYVATLNRTEQNTSSVICSSCKNSLYTVPMAELFICQVCRNITTED